MLPVRLADIWSACKRHQRTSSPVAAQTESLCSNVELAEGVGFEPTRACALPVFKTGAINHSTTPPVSAVAGIVPSLDCSASLSTEHGHLAYAANGHLARCLLRDGAGETPTCRTGKMPVLRRCVRQPYMFM